MANISFYGEKPECFMQKTLIFCIQSLPFFRVFGIFSTLVRDPMSTQQAGNIVSSVSDSRTLVLQEKILMTSLDTISGQLWGVKH